MALTNKRVLIIDDEPAFRKLIGRVLEVAGMQVAEAENVRSGLAMAEKTPPHLVLLDLNMPEESGFVFLGLKRSSPALRQIPIIVMTAVSGKEAVFKAISLGAADYVIKSTSATILLQKTRKALRDKAFLEYAFPDFPEVELQTPAKIVQMNEAELLLESPLRIAPHSEIDLQADLFQALDCGEIAFKTGPLASRSGSPRRYLSRVRLMGVTEKVATRIRIKVRSWT